MTFTGSVINVINVISSDLQASLQQVSGSASVLHFDPIRIVLLIAWIYYCMYCIQRIEYGPLVADRFKPAANAFGLIIAPFILFVLFVRDIVKRVQAGEIEYADIPRIIFNLKLLKTQRKASGRRFIQLLDSAGKEFFGTEDSKTADADRHILNAFEDIILDALQERATDILMDPKTDGFHSVRYRVDGFLKTVQEIEAENSVPIVNSIKALSKMDISEKRRPQDGAFMARVTDGKVSFRVASSGVLGGEKISIRILDQSTGILKLKDIGLSKSKYQLVANAIKQPSGMIIVCGPTGSGKTTSLYAMLSTMDFYSRNVITVEDPIEHVLPEASQIEVNVKADITFATALRSILRQDPDVITVGEIRDNETAAMALQASQTGHLVLATLHSSSNLSALVRLMDLDVKPLLLASALSMVISQRLVRKLCDKCKEPAKLSEGQIERFKSKGIDPSVIMQPGKCKRCGHTGYRGRLAITDVLVINDKIKALLTESNVSIGELKKQGDKKGKSTLRDDGLAKVYAGLTTLDEIRRVTSNLG
ncbi:MAG: type II/IV secretion system protein [Planctomycetes bacterium]|nr:type II/IV secretion system protein [Planctomycetota bacterium]